MAKNNGIFGKLNVSAIQICHCFDCSCDKAEMAGLKLQRTQMFHNSARFLLILPMIVILLSKAS